jgi:hypothetical protein
MTKKLLYLFFILFSLLDLYLTNHFLTNTIIKEFNPIASLMFKHSGLIGLLFLKTFSIIVFILCCFKIGTVKPKTEKNLLTIGLSLMSSVVIYSYYAIKTEKLIVLDSSWEKMAGEIVQKHNYLFRMTDNFLVYFIIIYFLINLFLYFFDPLKKEILNDATD